MTMDQDFEDLKKRVTKLEVAVFGTERKTVQSFDKQVKTPSGPSGGISILIDEGYFSQPRSTNDVKTKLEEKGYFYRREVIQTALNRLSTTSGPLTHHKLNNTKVYVVRK